MSISSDENRNWATALAIGRRTPPSATQWPPCVGFSGPKRFLHSRLPERRCKNSLANSGNSYSTNYVRPRKPRKLAKVELRFRVHQGVLAPHVFLVRRPQQLQKVHSALALSGGERGEQRVGDHGGIGVFPQVPRRRVVGLERARHLPRRRQQGVLLLVKRAGTFRQQAVDLAGRDLDAQVQQFFVNQRLRDVVVMILIEYVSAEPRPKLPLDLCRQGGRPAGAVGQQVAQPPGEDIMGFDLQVLYHEVLATVISRALRT